MDRKHAVPVIAGKYHRRVIDHLDEARVTALVGHGRPAFVIHRTQEKHIAAFDEILVWANHFRLHCNFLDNVGHAPRFKLFLQLPVIITI